MSDMHTYIVYMYIYTYCRYSLSSWTAIKIRYHRVVDSWHSIYALSQKILTLDITVAHFGNFINFSECSKTMNFFLAPLYEYE